MPAAFPDNLFFKRPAVHPDADRDIPLLCRPYNSAHFFFIPYIAGIDTDFIRPVLHRLYGKAVIKMDIRHKRDMNLLFNFRKCTCCLHGRHCRAHNFAAGLLKFKNLSHSGRHILRPCVGHGLDCNRTPPAYCYITDPDFSCTVSHFTAHPLSC